jgi:hypothetical protein
MAVAGLGRRVALHEGDFSGGGWLWYIGAISLLSGVAWLFAPGASRSSASSPAQRMFIALAALIVGAGCTLVAVYRWRQSVEVYDRGFVWRRLGGSTVVHRGEMSEAKKVVWESRHFTVVTVEVTLRDGRELTLRGFPDPDKLQTDLRALLAP